MAEQVAHLRQRYVALDEPAGVLVPEILPVQIDALECFLAPPREMFPAALFAPVWSDTVRAQHREYPGLAEDADRLAGPVAEDVCFARLLLAGRVQA